VGLHLGPGHPHFTETGVTVEHLSAQAQDQMGRD
jgi:hypothetical protein